MGSEWRYGGAWERFCGGRGTVLDTVHARPPRYFVVYDPQKQQKSNFNWDTAQSSSTPPAYPPTHPQ